MVASAVPTGHACVQLSMRGTIFLEGVCKVPARASTSPQDQPKLAPVPRSLVIAHLSPHSWGPVITLCPERGRVGWVWIPRPRCPVSCQLWETSLSQSAALGLGTGQMPTQAQRHTRRAPRASVNGPGCVQWVLAHAGNPQSSCTDQAPEWGAWHGWTASPS